MVPYRGRLALRIARFVLALACLAWYARSAEERFTSILAVLAAYAAYAIGALFEAKFDSAIRAGIALIADALYFGFWNWLIAAGWLGWPAAGWPAALLCGYLLASAAILHDLRRVLVTSGVAVLLALLFAPRGEVAIVWVALGAAGVAISEAFLKRYLERRLSHTLRHNVIIRSQAQGAREAERQRIAADFHDGPLQSFISFQMRLEIIRKLLSRDVEAAREELTQLQELCKTQVSDLRSFVRSMRPPDEGVSLPASLSRMVDQFQRDTGIQASFSSQNQIHDPAETEVSLELLQIIRETMHNIQKHSGATRMALSMGMRDHKIEIRAEDNGSGFPFSGSFSLDELELLRLGPASIKRRVRMLNGEMQLESRPGQGTTLEIRIPV
ncbi:MAG TPA: sensor histidine kinase [Bryobacteraceae bacterium]|jgi:signal transduction histidine kinase|nr:sensor histidine kinase [Bryobacteraceae bacterium]